MFLRNIFEALERTGQGKSAVIGWGRGMGHKGHMFLASSVITQAKETGSDPYFVVSKTVGKDDPINPDEKLAIYKKVFPQSGHIFQTATDEMPDLTRVLTKLNQMGYTDATVVVGADQVNALGYVKNYNGKPDKSGNIPFSFNTLTVISRQETNDPSKDQEGPRATPMRAVLMDPAKSEEEKFAVWRDAMNPELSDEEVMDLMHKAEQRMRAMVKPKKVKAVAEAGSNAIDTVAKRLTDPKDGMSAKLRAAGDKKRDSQYMSSQIAKNDRTSKDEWGNLKELSNDTLGRYKKAASADATTADKAGDFKRADKRFSGIVKATKKQFTNDNKGVNEFAMSGGDDGEDPFDNYPCYDCGSTIFLHHTKLCDLAEPNAIHDLPSKPGSQHWTGQIPKGLHPIPGLQEGMSEEWSKKYKSSINCSHPKGFSQKAHCAGKKKHNEDVVEAEGGPTGVPHVTKELLKHIVQQVGTEGAHAIIKSLQWGDGAAKELLHLIVKDLKNDISMAESVKQRIDKSCWKGYKKQGTKMKGDTRVNNCVPVSESVEDIIDSLINKIITNEATSNSGK
jgi:hypothetical protein